MVSFFHGARLMMGNPKQSELPQLANSILVTSPLFHVSGLHCAAVTALAGGAKNRVVDGALRPGNGGCASSSRRR